MEISVLRQVALNNIPSTRQPVKASGELLVHHKDCKSGQNLFMQNFINMRTE